MIFLECPFTEKDECKSLGGRWDSEAKKWFIPNGVNPAPFSKWMTNKEESEFQIPVEEKNIVTLAPSSLDYQPKCPRCFYLKQIHGIQSNNRPPPVFSRFDIIQKAFFLDKNTSNLCSQLPSGKFFLDGELPGMIYSKVFEDNKQRKFKLGGKPDLVIKFDNGEFGIIDFKTTKLSPNKCDSYKFQLESYAQIFENPGRSQSKETPLLKPITHIGVLQFDPNEITSSDDSGCNMVMKMDYSPIIKRNPEEFFERITLILDILHNKNIPDFSTDCNDCNFHNKQLVL